MTAETAAEVPDPELAEFIHRWAEAIAANDVASMERFVTRDWLLVDRPGLGTREGFHAAVADGRLRHDTMSHEVLMTRRLSPDVALLITRGRNTGSYQGEPFTADEWTTDVLVRTPTGWRCTLTQLTPAARRSPGRGTRPPPGRRSRRRSPARRSSPG